jgi:hypothetical protein
MVSDNALVINRMDAAICQSGNYLRPAVSAGLGGPPLTGLGFVGGRVQPGTWGTDYTGHMGNTFLRLQMSILERSARMLICDTC